MQTATGEVTELLGCLSISGFPSLLVAIQLSFCHCPLGSSPYALLLSCLKWFASHYFVSFSPCVAGEVTAFAAAALQAREHLILDLDT